MGDLPGSPRDEPTLLALLLLSAHLDSILLLYQMMLRWNKEGAAQTLDMAYAYARVLCNTAPRLIPKKHLEIR